MFTCQVSVRVRNWNERTNSKFVEWAWRINFNLCNSWILQIFLEPLLNFLCLLVFCYNRFICTFPCCRKRKCRTSTRLAKSIAFASCSTNFRRTIMRCATVLRYPKTRRKNCGSSLLNESARPSDGGPYANYLSPIRCPPLAIRFVSIVVKNKNKTVVIVKFKRQQQKQDMFFFPTLTYLQS